MPPAPARPFQTWIPIPPLVGWNEFAEPMSAGQLVRTLRQYADITEKGQALLAGTPSEKKLHHSEMRSYLDQALTYFRVAESIEGSPGALPLYYSCLNLAKAELLRTQPAQIYKKKIQHGLSYDPD